MGVYANERGKKDENLDMKTYSWKVDLSTILAKEEIVGGGGGVQLQHRGREKRFLRVGGVKHGNKLSQLWNL